MSRPAHIRLWQSTCLIRGGDVSLMKLLMTLGGLLGFSIGVVAGWVQDLAWPQILWRASVAALLAGVVLRWWGRVWVGCFQDSLKERAAQAAKTGTTPAIGQTRV